MVRLTLRVPSAIPVEVYGITPERVANLPAAEVAKLPVLCGNRREELGQFFDVSTRVTTAPQRADLQFAGDTRNVKGIGAGMASGFVYVERDAGMHAGAGMSGGELVIDSSAGDWLGAEMTGGSIDVRGSAGALVGAAYRGGRRGMAGGVIRVRGDAGAELGLLMRRGMILVDGTVGEFAGASMIAGTIVAGGFGQRVGAGMKRGTLVALRGDVPLGPGFRFSCEYRPAFLGLLAAELRRMGFDPAERLGPRPVRCFRGDLMTGGNGEVLVVG